MNDTHITVVGRVVADPVLRPTTSGAAMATFRIATNARKRKAGAPGEFEDGPTSFYGVRAFRSLGANLAVALRKGHPVVVSGTLEITDYARQDGTRGTAGEITASAVGHDLSWGITSFTKVMRGAAGESIAADPHVQASGQAMAQSLADEALDLREVEGEVVDPVTGEIRYVTDPAA